MTGQEMQLIAVDPVVLHGQAHIRGARIPVRLVLGCLAEGLTEDEIFVEYPPDSGRRPRRGPVDEITLDEVR